MAEPEADTSGDFREPHPEEPGDEHAGIEPAEEIPPAPAEMPAEPVAEIPRAPRNRNANRRPERTAQPEHRRPEPPRPKPWVKPADFRPAETSAISQAVAHATEIAESLKHTIDQLDEILELVELAERQKLADEREIDELRRASAASSRRATSRHRAARAMTSRSAVTRNMPRAVTNHVRVAPSRGKMSSATRNRAAAPPRDVGKARGAAARVTGAAAAVE